MQVMHHKRCPSQSDCSSGEPRRQQHISVDGLSASPSQRHNASESTILYSFLTNLLDVNMKLLWFLLEDVIFVDDNPHL